MERTGVGRFWPFPVWQVSGKADREAAIRCRQPTGSDRITIRNEYIIAQTEGIS
jgi:hypothetical protein